MATFAERIKAYTNFDADSGGNAGVSNGHGGL